MEAGGFLVGANHPSWLALAERFGLKLLDIASEPVHLSSPLVLDGVRLQPSEAEAGLGRLSFVGEHTSPVFFRFLEGALESGVRRARWLAKVDGLA